MCSTFDTLRNKVDLSVYVIANDMYKVAQLCSSDVALGLAIRDSRFYMKYETSLTTHRILFLIQLDCDIAR